MTTNYIYGKAETSHENTWIIGLFLFWRNVWNFNLFYTTEFHLKWARSTYEPVSRLMDHHLNKANSIWWYYFLHIIFQLFPSLLRYFSATPHWRGPKCPKYRSTVAPRALPVYIFSFHLYNSFIYCHIYWFHKKVLSLLGSKTFESSTKS